MSAAQGEILAIAMVTAMACALPGVFLVLRRLAMVSDAISHSLLPGIVLAYFLTKDLSSPWLVVGAAATGVLTVALVEALTRTRRLKEDAAMGLVFPALFSIGVLMITRYAGNVHLDVDSVLLGELAYAPFSRLEVGGVDLGARGLWLMSTVLVLNFIVISLFFKELKLATFDAGLAGALGFAPVILHYGLMSLVSLTSVGAFDTVGLILVVALMVGPPATAYLLTDNLKWMLALAAFCGALSAVLGFALATWLDGSIAGSMAVAVGLVFAVVFVTAPRHGWWAGWRRRRRQRWEVAQVMLAIHLWQHEGAPDEAEESRVDHLYGKHVGWTPEFTHRTVERAIERHFVERNGARLALTNRGREEAAKALRGLTVEGISEGEFHS